MNITNSKELQDFMTLYALQKIPYYYGCFA